MQSSTIHLSRKKERTKERKSVGKNVINIEYETLHCSFFSNLALQQTSSSPHSLP